jgi:hypothetical protein
MDRFDPAQDAPDADGLKLSGHEHIDILGGTDETGGLAFG